MASNKKARVAHQWDPYLDKPNALFFLLFKKEFPESFRRVIDRAIAWLRNYADKSPFYAVDHYYFVKLALAMTQDNATEIEKCVNKVWLKPENIIRIFTNMIKTIGAVYAKTNQHQFELNALEHEAANETRAAADAFYAFEDDDEARAYFDLKTANAATLTKAISETKKKHEFLIQYISVEIGDRVFTDDYSLEKLEAAEAATEGAEATETEGAAKN
jgi:hypothetical protein